MHVTIVHCLHSLQSNKWCCVMACIRCCVMACIRCCVVACIRCCVVACIRCCVMACIRCCVVACIRCCVMVCIRCCVMACSRCCVVDCIRCCVMACIDQQSLDTIPLYFPYTTASGIKTPYSYVTCSLADQPHPYEAGTIVKHSLHVCFDCHRVLCLS